MKESVTSILLLESNAEHADAINTSLAKAKSRYCIETVASLDAFLNKMNMFVPDIIIFDLDLPDAKTPYVLERVLKDKQFPVLAMTAPNKDATADKALKEGTLDYVVKTAQTFREMPRIVARELREWRLLQDHRQIESLLQQSESRYRSVVEDQSELICRYRVDGKLSLVNEAYARYYKKTRVELIDQNFIPHIPEPDLTTVKKRIAEIAREKPMVSFDHRIITPDGDVRWQEWTHRGIYSETGGLLEYQAVGRDITDRKRAENALLRSESKFRAIFDFTSDAVMLLDRNGFLDCNKATLALFGCAREEFFKKHPADVSPLTQPCGTSSLDLAALKIELAFQRGSLRFDWVHKRLDTGAAFPAEVLLSAMELDGKQVVQAIVRDITERKRTEHEKDECEARNRVIKKADSLGRMAGAIAHLFNNMMHVVIGNIELAVTDLPATSPAVEQLLGAMKAARKAAKMSGRMLSYLGQVQVKLEPLDLSEICQKGLSMLQYSLPKDMILKNELPMPGPIIQANANQIQQVLTNLITNAWEACANEHGNISLSVKTVPASDMPVARHFYAAWQPPAGAHACLEVSDTGCGVAPAYFEQLFDPFFTTKFTGRGLGLPVVLGIMRTHGGGIVMKSKLGEGSSFQLYFPISTQVTSKLEKAAVSTNETNHGGTVLLVEDEEIVRNLANKMLSHLGFTVLAAKNGAEAVELFRQRQKEVLCVLCDLDMPMMNGWAVLAALRKISPHVPVILASGYDESQVMAEEHAERPQAFLGKPYQLTELRETLTRVLSMQSKPT